MQIISIFLSKSSVDDLLELEIVRNFIRENKGTFLNRESPPPPPEVLAAKRGQRLDQIQRRKSLE